MSNWIAYSIHTLEKAAVQCFQLNIFIRSILMQKQLKKQFFF